MYLSTIPDYSNDKDDTPPAPKEEGTGSFNLFDFDTI